MYDGKIGNFVAAFTKASRGAGQDADAIDSERRNQDGSIVKLVDVCRQYGEGPNVVNALYHVNARISKGEFVAVVGASGSGKSTFLNVCGGLDKPTSGDIYVEGIDIGKLASDELTEFRRKRIGFVFQNYNLISVMSVYENIVLPVQMGGNLEDRELLGRIMDALGLTGLEHRLPSELSGGQQQRVAIARALISTPAIILADEPTGNLDSSSAEDVMELLKRAVRDFGQTVIMITHNEALIGECDRILHMKDGRLEER
ncbi:MAG: ABC transporter ATP-binding protein [Lachnospiraceae bacterium]|nr:ABC transporter ATP-binding protein [Lachnospiraceae bacterium]